MDKINDYLGWFSSYCVCFRKPSLLTVPLDNQRIARLEQSIQAGGMCPGIGHGLGHSVNHTRSVAVSILIRDSTRCSLGCIPLNKSSQSL